MKKGVAAQVELRAAFARLPQEGGTRRAFGPKEEVLREMVTNHRQIAAQGPVGGVT